MQTIYPSDYKISSPNTNNKGPGCRANLPTELQKQILIAAQLLRDGENIAFPTETVYGLGADISNISAIEQIFKIKGRPKTHPLIVHFADLNRLHVWAQNIPESAWRLAQHFWPGPLTLILKRSKQIPSIVTGNRETVGLRVPSHPVALALLDALGPDQAIAAPSANRFGCISPTTADHVGQELGQRVKMILDGGACQIGLESTIVDFSNDTATVLRPGGIPIPALEAVLEKQIPFDHNKNTSLAAPGTLASHYAPDTPLEIWPAETIWRRVRQLELQEKSAALLTWSFSDTGKKTLKNAILHTMPSDPVKYGSQLYAVLRQLDQKHLDHLLIEMPPKKPAWLAINDRLQRAKHKPLQA